MCTPALYWQMAQEWKALNLKYSSLSLVWKALQKDKLNHLHVATVGNPGMHIPTMLGGLPGMEAVATKMMKSKIEKLDIPPVDEFLEILTASGTKLWACKLAMDMFDVHEENLIEDLDGVLTVGDFYARAEGDGTHVIFI